MKSAIAVIVAVLIIAGGAFVIMKKNDNKKSTTNTTSQTTNNAPANNASDNSQPANNQSSPAAATITYSDSGFSPSKITVKSGDKVEIKNTSSHSMQFDSNPHPVHTDDPELNVGVVAAGQSMTFTVTTKGTFGYHNHLDSSQTGSIVVE